MALITNPEDIAFIFENPDHTYTVGINRLVQIVEKDRLGRPQRVEKMVVKNELVSKVEGEHLAGILEKRRKQLDDLTKTAPLKERDIRHYGKKT